MKKWVGIVILISLFSVVMARGGQVRNDRQDKVYEPRGGGLSWFHKKGEDRREKGYVNGQFIEKLNLTKEQKKKMVDLGEEFKDERNQGVKEMAEMRRDLHEELAEKNLDEGKINSLVDKLQKSYGNMLREQVRFMKENRKILTDEQLENMQKFVESREEEYLDRKLERHGFWGGGHHRR